MELAMLLSAPFRNHRSSRSRARSRTSPRRPSFEFLEQRSLLTVNANVTFAITSDWGAGFGANMTIQNTGTAAVSGWTLGFDFNRNIDQIWNASIVSHTGTHYVLKDLGYNGSINVGASISFGFNGSAGNVTSPPANYVFNGQAVGSGAAQLPSLAVANAAVTEGTSGSTPLNFTVTLSAAATSNVSVAYATANGTAIAGTDYTATSGTLTFAPGQTTQTVAVPIINHAGSSASKSLVLNLSSASAATIGTGQATGVINYTVPPPSISINNVTVQEPTTTGSSGSSTLLGAGYFHTSGNQILDSNNNVVRIAGVNWFGFESTGYVADGLWAQSYKTIMNEMVQQGFNTIRLPFSDQLFDAGSTPSSINYNLNPDLVGLNGLGIMDKIVAYAGQIGLKIFLDHHRSEAGDGAEGSGLWYTSTYSQSRWIADWTMLATHYANNPTVIGGDLANEPHGPATWGGGGADDWHAAAQLAGNAILAVNPNWLIIVEGVETGPSGSDWWGGNLSSAGANPVVLNSPGHVVYSPHDYPASVYPQSWFSASNYPNNLPSVWNANWGYLYQQNIAPVLLGEFGTLDQTTSDMQWLSEMVQYLNGGLSSQGGLTVAPGQQGPSWTFWSWNPNSGDTGGLVQNDWITVETAKVNALKPLQFPWTAGATGTGGGTSATFSVSLSSASNQTVTVNYGTTNGTATAGTDYTSESGTVTFAPGVTQQSIAIPILANSKATTSETFSVNLSGASNATIANGQGTGTIQVTTTQPTLPNLSVANVSVDRGTSGTTPLTFTVKLSAASKTAVTVAYSTSNGTAIANTDYQPVSGTVTFAPGVTAMTIAVPVIGTTLAGPSKTFNLLLSSPTGATLAVAQAVGTLLDTVKPPPGVTPTFAVQNDWGSGYVAAFTLTNTGASAVNGWTLEFDLAGDISNIWNATIVSHVGTHYVIQAASYDQVIAANGGSVSFGIQAAPGGVTVGPKNWVLNGVAIG